MDENRAIEERYLTKVLALLKNEAERLELATTGQLTDLAEHGYKMWDELSHVIRDFDDVAALATYDADMTRQEMQHRAQLRELRDILSLYRIPYFGRLDFTSDRDGIEEQVYIGAHSFTDKKTYEPYIYDWRTPIASMYYDSDIGPAGFDSPDGRETGTISLMRRYRIRNGKLRLMYDVSTGVSDDMLGAALSENANARLKVIVESIQREQNRAIRDEAAGDLLVIGPAGSGKTSVGLHRFAYLLYRRRGSLTNKNLEIISRSGIFASYIGDILPELGEEDARRTLFEDILLPLVPEKYDLPDYNAQLEYALRAKPGDTRLEAIRLKGSADFLSYLPTYFKRFRFDMPDVTAAGEVLLPGAELTRRCQELLETRPFEVVLDYARNYVNTVVEDYYGLNEKEIKEKLWREGNYFGDEVEEEFIRRRRGDAAATVALIETANLPEDGELYLTLLRDYAKDRPHGAEIIALTEKTLVENRLDYEDALCVAALRTITGKAKPRSHVRQLLLDEGQDYNAVQHFILKKIYPNAQFTVLADPNQAAFPAIGIADETGLSAAYPGSHTLRLSRSYRSTGPINRLASAVLGLENPDFFDRQGAMPLLILTKDVPAAARAVAAALTDCDTVGIICPTGERARAVHAALPEARLYIDSDDELAGGVAVLPAALSKGLEFDAVIADCGGLDDRLIYLLSTRALHRLYLISEDGIPAPLEGLRELYEVKRL